MMTPASSLTPVLNRFFIDHEAQAILEEASFEDYADLCRLLMQMGASESQIRNWRPSKRCGEPARTEDGATFPTPFNNKVLLNWMLRGDVELPEMPLSHEINRASSPFTSPILRDWFFRTSAEEFTLARLARPFRFGSWCRMDDNLDPERVSGFVRCVGEGPFGIEDFNSFLKSEGMGFSDGPLSALIIGRVGWAVDDVRNLLEQHNKAAIHSQESFLGWWTRPDENNFHLPHPVLSIFLQDHPAKQFISE